MNCDSDWILVKGVLVFCYYSLRVEDGGKGKKNYGITKDFLIFFYMIIDDFVVAWYSMGCAIQEVNLIQSNGSVLKPSCKPTLLSTQFHKPI